MKNLFLWCVVVSVFAMACGGEITDGTGGGSGSMGGGSGAGGGEAGLGGGNGMGGGDGSGGGANTGGGSSVNSSSAVLTWVAPTANEDNTPLTDLGGFNVKRGTASGEYTQTIDVGNVVTYTVEDLPAATHYFVVTAYDTAGNESKASNEASKVIP